jgi:hypothetical protein
LLKRKSAFSKPAWVWLNLTSAAAVVTGVRPSVNSAVEWMHVGSPGDLNRAWSGVSTRVDRGLATFDAASVMVHR